MPTVEWQPSKEAIDFAMDTPGVVRSRKTVIATLKHAHSLQTLEEDPSLRVADTTKL